MKNFYIYILLVTLTSNAVKAEDEAQKEKIFKDCMVEVKVSEDVMKKFFADPTKMNDAVKCHLKCTMEKRGVLKNGIFDTEAFLKTMKTYPAYKNRQDDIIKTCDDCKKLSGSNDCTTGYNIYKCLREHKTDIFAI